MTTAQGWTSELIGTEGTAAAAEQAARLAALQSGLVGVRGHSFEDEVWAVHEAARTAPGRPEGITVVDVGAGQGRATIGAAYGIRSREAGDRGVVVAIDRRARDFTELVRNVERAGVSEVVQAMRVKPRAARRLFDDRSVDVVRLNATRDYDDLMDDLAAWEHAIGSGGRLVVTGTNYPGVRQALVEHVLSGPSQFRNPRLVRHTVLLDVLPASPWTRTDDLAVARLKAVLAVRERAGRYADQLPENVRRWGNTISTLLVG